MDYTEAQFSLLDKLNKGVCLDDLSEEDRMLLHFLDTRGLVQPREDLRPGWLTLSEEGKLALLRRDADIRDKQEQEERRCREKAEETATRRTERRANCITQISVALLSALLSNLDRIIPLVRRFGKLLWKWFRSLF